MGKVITHEAGRGVILNSDKILMLFSSEVNHYLDKIETSSCKGKIIEIIICRELVDNGTIRPYVNTENTEKDKYVLEIQIVYGAD